MNIDYQDIYPMTFITLGEVLGNMLAAELTLHQQNTIGNWFQLLGQVIETHGTQQLYFENGPGRFFDPKNKNIDNPNCQTPAPEDTSALNDGREEGKEQVKCTRSESCTACPQKCRYGMEKCIDELNERIRILEAKLDELSDNK